MSTADASRLSMEEKRALLRRLLHDRAARPRQEYPLSHGQRALWFLHQLEPDSTAYNVLFAVRVRSVLDVDILRSALQTLTDRYTSLRTTFEDRGGEPIQVVHRQWPVALAVTDASGWAEDRLYREVSREAYRPFDLEKGPLFRGTIFARTPEDHVLLFAVHHIIGDFWSLVLLMSDLRRIYLADSHGEQVHLPPLSVQYADYVRWQREMLAGGEGERLWQYWSRQLAGDLPRLNLPTDRPYPATPTDRGGAAVFPIDDGLSLAVREFARAEGVTLFTVLLAAWQVLLYRYTRQADILVGSPAAGRGKRGFEQIFGLLTNMIVLRADLSGNPQFRDFLQQVRQTVLDGLDHQDYPFSLLVERLQPIRDPSRPPIYQAAFLMEKSHLLEEQGAAALMMGQSGATWELGGLKMEPFGLRAESTPFEISLIVEDGAGRLAGCIQYNTDLFEETTVQRLARGYVQILAAITTDPQQRVARITLLPDAERSRMLRVWNDTDAVWATSACCHDLIDERAIASPDRIAVVCGHRSLCYKELQEQSNRLARHLRGLGVRRGTVVGICVERSVDMVVGLLGILKAGGAYLPLDPAFPRDRLALMLEDSAAMVLVTEQSLAADFPAYTGELVCLDAQRHEIARESCDRLDASAGPEDLAYVIYTSGSTGLPKGVEVSHRALSNFLHSIERTPGLDASDVLLSVTTLSFDIFGLELYLPLVCGACVVVADRLAVGDPVRLGDLLVRSGATVMQATPATWRMLIDAGWTGAPGLKAMIGGEALAPQLAHRLVALCGSLWNLYGPTETTIWSTAAEVTPGFDRVTIGRPIANTQIYLLDEHLQPTPIGVSGELCIAGAGLARGYRNRPELTAERFVPNPFSQEPGSRLYRTGDLARWLPDGRIECLGRMDHQVKVRGFRIELGEIETALAAHPDIRQAVVVARPDATGQNRLCGYVVSEVGGALAIELLRDHLRPRLPDYMIPSTFMVLDAFPLTPNGKVDRAALPIPDAVRPELQQQYVAPRTPTEELLVGIWAEVLGLEQVGVRDNFFELGGHSLLATQVVSRIRSRCQVDLPLRELFEDPTIATLGAAVDRGQRGQTLAPVARIDRSGPLPLSFAQERLWFLDHLDRGSAAYNIPAAVRIEGVLDTEALAAALNEIVLRHESLRSRFETVDGRPVQRIDAHLRIELPVIEASGEAEAHGIANELAGQPFALDTGPLLRARLIRLSDREHIFVLTVHHIVSDGWSMGVFLRELAAVYGAFSEGRRSPLAELPFDYADFANWQREYLKGGILESQLAYWTEKLASLPGGLDLPTDRPRPAKETYRGAIRPVRIPPELADALNRLSQAEGATLFMTLLAAFQTLLARYARQDQIAVGTPIAGRTRAEFEGLIGLFVNTVVLPGDLSGAPTFRELLRRTRETTLEAHAHQDLPFEYLVDRLQPQRDLSRSPLFQTMFVLQNAPLPTVHLAGLSFVPLEVHSGTSKFELTLMLQEGDAGIQGSVEYNTDLFDASTIDRLIGHYVSLLSAIVDNVEGSVWQAEMLLGAERREVLESFNATAADYDLDGTLEALFEAQVDRTPAATALVYEDRQLSYRELDDQTNRLAHRLRQEGVGPDGVVAVMAYRSIELVEALYGVLKAGGAYLPLDPDYPAARIAAILADSGVEVVLVEPGLEDRLGEWAGGRIALEASSWQAESPERPERLAGAENLAYVIYTSGSTGVPKGVAVPHAGIRNRLLWMQEAYGLTAADRVLQKTPYSFDVSVWEFFWPLISGATLVVARAGGHQDSGYLVELIRRERISVLHFVPSMLRVFLEEENLRQCESLRLVVTSGEALPYPLARRVHERLPAVALENLYGPTEASVDVTRWSCPAAGDPRRIVPIGRPIANTRTYVLSSELEVLPVGVAGEL
ncbi:MAG: amino acid adenylation domain-containing protein, partial [Rhodopirellula sp.]|nr:amino acid adenylation domain-containing protein [Rhodopirellula sp.]